MAFNFSMYLPLIVGVIVAIITISWIALYYRSMYYDLVKIPYYDITIYNKRIFYAHRTVKVTNKTHTILKLKGMAFIAPKYDYLLFHKGSGTYINYDLDNAQSLSMKTQKEVDEELKNPDSFIGRYFNKKIRVTIDPSYFVESRLSPDYLNEVLEAQIASDIMAGGREKYAWLIPMVSIGIVVIGIIVVLAMLHSWGMLGEITQNVTNYQAAVQPTPTPFMNIIKR